MAEATTKATATAAMAMATSARGECRPVTVEGDALRVWLNGNFRDDESGLKERAAKELDVVVKKKEVQSSNGGGGNTAVFLFKYKDVPFANPITPLPRLRLAAHTRTAVGTPQLAVHQQRFFNLTEPQCCVTVSDIAAEPSRFCLREKADGTCMQLFFTGEDWHVTTLGAVDSLSITGKGPTYKELFVQLVTTATNLSWADFSAMCDRRATHVFELCDVSNRILTVYPTPRVYYICSLWTCDGSPAPSPFVDRPVLGICEPLTVPCSTLPKEAFCSTEALSTFCDGLDANRGDGVYHPEGFVLYRDGIPVAKIKHPAYIELLKGQGNLTAAVVTRLFFERKLDDIDISKSVCAMAFVDALRSVVSEECALVSAVALDAHRNLGGLLGGATARGKAQARKEFFEFVNAKNVTKPSMDFLTKNAIAVIETGTANDFMDYLSASKHQTWIDLAIKRMPPEFQSQWK